MEKQTYLAHEIDSSDLRAQYDEHVKKLLKDKGVLAYILIYSVAEFKDYTIEEAKSAIEGEPIVSKKSVRPEAIYGVSNEINNPGEGKTFFDIVFFVITKDNARQKIYINVEAQKTFRPGYDLVTRGVVYGARLLSDQLDKEFTTDNYDGAKKVYSIWICMNTPFITSEQENVADTITEYSFSPKRLYQTPSIKETKIFGRYDLISVLFICLKDSTIRSENKLIGMLSTLLSDKLNVNDKKEQLENEYSLPMSKEMEKEAAAMCNLSEAIAEEKDAKISELTDALNKQKKESEEKDAEILLLKQEIERLKKKSNN